MAITERRSYKQPYPRTIRLHPRERNKAVGKKTNPGKALQYFPFPLRKDRDVTITVSGGLKRGEYHAVHNGGLRA